MSTPSGKKVSSAFGIVALTFCTFWSGTDAHPAAAAEKAYSLFTPVPATADINEKQALLLDHLSKRMTTKKNEKVQVVRMQRPMPQADVPLALNVIPNSPELTNYRVTMGERAGFLTWRGAEDRNTVALAWKRDGTACSGLIYANNRVYEVTPLGGGLQAVVPLDQSMFHEDHPKEEFEKLEKNKLQKELPVAAANPASDAALTEITVLVAYTTSVKDNVANGDVDTLINGAVAVANNSYINSKVNIKLSLVHTVEVAYMESGTHATDLARFRSTNDGVMDSIHTLRNDHHADVCVLLINNDSFCGLAAAILAEKETAFAVVHYDCAVGNLSFAHEIGHLQGARHNTQVDPTVDPSFPWNHGYLIPGTDGRTVMAYPTATNPNRLPLWSNPDVKYQGVAAGKAASANNARMLNSSAAHISSFR